jgi:hypothetical protein
VLCEHFEKFFRPRLPINGVSCQALNSIFILLIKILFFQRNPTLSMTWLCVGLRWKKRGFYHKSKIANIDFHSTKAKLTQPTLERKTHLFYKDIKK